MDNSKAFLDLKIVWKDVHMFELRVIASNGRFSGTTDVFDTSDSMLNFAQLLKGFPIGNKTLFYEAGKKDGYAYFAMKFYPVDNYGHVGVLINLEGNVPNLDRPEEKDKITLELLVEPNAIDNFQRELLHLAKDQEGNATLFGMSKA